ncbi:hypothetical protein DM02DRAFT_684488 [Periconia macrospinosa]|uniref:RING-type domain-containing protein n=1 Tax=Periconia macrospinosa TaxID=97972 RepID=A0A2V1DHP9_9PLEO|nr:hypothetical protein DM02DRAFT_684488 [Periconia macrospinosa]
MSKPRRDFSMNDHDGSRSHSGRVGYLSRYPQPGEGNMNRPANIRGFYAVRNTASQSPDTETTEHGHLHLPTGAPDSRTYFPLVGHEPDPPSVHEFDPFRTEPSRPHDFRASLTHHNHEPDLFRTEAGHVLIHDNNDCGNDQQPVTRTRDGRRFCPRAPSHPRTQEIGRQIRYPRASRVLATVDNDHGSSRRVTTPTLDDRIYYVDTPSPIRIANFGRRGYYPRAGQVPAAANHARRPREQLSPTGSGEDRYPPYHTEAVERQTPEYDHSETQSYALLQNISAILERHERHLGESSPTWNARLPRRIFRPTVSPWAQAFIDGLPAAVRDPGSEDIWTECICSEEYSEEHPAVRLPCKHVFGKSCIEKWCKSANQGAEKKCPYCRNQLFW